MWQYTSVSGTGGARVELEPVDEASFHLQPEEEEDVGVVTSADVYSWRGTGATPGGAANWAVAAGFSDGMVRLYRGGISLLRTTDAAPVAQLRLLPASSAHSITQIAAIAMDSEGLAAAESGSAPAYHLIAALEQDMETCTENQQRKGCKQLVHLLVWEPEAGSLTLSGTGAPPPVAKNGKQSGTIALLSPYAAGKAGFIMLDVTGRVLIVPGVPLPGSSVAAAAVEATPPAATTEKSDAEADDDLAGDFEEPEEEVEEVEEGLFGSEGEDWGGGGDAPPALKMVTCSDAGPPTPFGDVAGLSWAVDPLWPTSFYSMHSRGARKVSLFHVRLDVIGQDPTKCLGRVVTSAGTAEPPARPLHKVCPMHGYLLGLGEEVSLWNTTAGGREKWGVLLGGSQRKSGGLGGGKKLKQALQKSDACTAAIVGDSEWLLLQTPAESAPNVGDTGDMRREELLEHLSDGEKIQEKAAGSTLVLVRSSLPFTHMTLDIKNMIMAVGAGVVLVSIGWHVSNTSTPTTTCFPRILSEGLLCDCRSTTRGPTPQAPGTNRRNRRSQTRALPCRSSRK